MLAAVQELQAGKHDAALVGGLDSLVDLSSLRTLAADNAVLGRGNPGGRVPAEGAAFALLSRTRALTKRGPLARLEACTVGRDPHPRTSDQPNTGLGLTGVFRALRRSFPSRVDEIYSAQTGELYYGREFSYAYLRNTALMPEPLRLAELGNTLGDAGAAAAPMATICALSSLHRARAPRDTALAYASSESGLTGACIVASLERKSFS